MKRRDLILIFGAFSFIALIILLSLLLGNHLEVRTCGCPKMISQNFIWLFTLLAIFFVGSLVYYLFSLKIEQKDRCVLKNLEILNSILDNDEKRVLDILVKKDGRIKQLDLSSEYGKIRAHRILKKLEDKGIIEVLRSGKGNIIKLHDELKKEFIK
jgi:uncharacterized membrane protein